MRKIKARALALFLLSVVSPLILAASSTGMPTRPKFNTVTITSPSGTTALTVNSVGVIPVNSGSLIIRGQAVNGQIPILVLDDIGPVSNNAVIRYNRLGVRRIGLVKRSDAESGGDTGSNFFIETFDDSGNHKDWPIGVYRSDGRVEIGKALAVVGAGTFTAAGTALTVTNTASVGTLNATTVNEGGTQITSRIIGYNQTPQDVTGSRSLTTIYQNQTGRPIQVLITTLIPEPGSGGTTNTFKVGTSTPPTVTLRSVGASGYGVALPFYVDVIIPAGNYYQLTGNSFTNWVELR